jgi:hypothetical protein
VQIILHLLGADASDAFDQFIEEAGIHALIMKGCPKESVNDRTYGTYRTYATYATHAGCLSSGSARS